MDSQVQSDAVPIAPDNVVQSDSTGHDFQKVTSTPIRVPVNKTDEHYKMDHRRRGRAIIFSQLNFMENLNLRQRTGGEKSAEGLKIALQNLGFDAVIHEDLTFNEIKEELKTISKEKDLENSDCILIAVLTHGGDEDQLYANDTHYTSKYLQDPFRIDNCAGLAGKPKIFILQACRGTKKDKGIQLQFHILQHSSTQTDGPPPGIENYKLPKHADFLTAYSSTRNFTALREPFIDALCEELSSKDVKEGNIDFLSMLTTVQRKVAIGEHDLMNKQMPSVTSTLTRKIFF